jgi:hypothetical protein
MNLRLPAVKTKADITIDKHRTESNMSRFYSIKADAHDTDNVKRVEMKS